MDGMDSLADLPGLGPRSQELLVRAGISQPAQLRALGSVAAFAAVRRSDPGVSLNLLWALESALSGEPWQAVARKYRTSLLLALEAHEAGTRPPSP